MANIKSIKIENENISFELKGHKQKIVSSVIKWNNKTNSLMYYVNEPELSEKERAVIFKIREFLKSKKKNINSIKDVIKICEKLKEKIGAETTWVQDSIIAYYVYRDEFGYGRLEGLIWDPDIKFISFDRIGAPITIFHKDYGYMPANVIIPTQNELSNLLPLLAGKCLSKNEDNGMFIGRTIMNSMIFINKNMDTFTVRKTQPVFYHPAAQLMKTGLANTEIISMIEFFLKNRGSVLVVGPDVCNKTEFISGIGSLLDNSRVLTFEVVPEVEILSKKWISEVLPLHMYTEKNVVNNLLRHNPDYVIADNITGYPLKRIINGLSKSYAGIVTVDAKSIEEGLSMLISGHTNLDKSVLANFDLIILLAVEKRGNRYLQRIKEVDEVLNYSHEEDSLKLNTIFSWDSRTDKIIPFRSFLLEKFVNKTGKSPHKLIEELKNTIKSVKLLAG